MQHESHTPEPSRRDLFNWAVYGLTGAAAASLMVRDGFAQSHTAPLSTLPHFPARARRVVHICLVGGLSHLDSFDYKPALEKWHGKPLETKEQPETFFGKVGLIRKNDWAFKQRGQSGLWVSDLFPHIATVADELTVIRSMVADSANHTPALFQQSTGFRFNGFPVMGSWIGYGLGTENDNLPSYVVLPDPRGMPPSGVTNWSNGFLPAQHQGVVFQSSGPAIRDLFPASNIDPVADADSRELIRELNRRHFARHPGDPVLDARMRSYELAARMQLAVPEVADLEGESESMRLLYGTDGKATKDFGRSCLLARRLLERGVRFVQLYSGGSFGSPRINWDGHEDVLENHNREAARVDQPVAALIHDLKQRGMLDDTLVLITSEFGRTPFTQTADNTVGKGRDHNMYGFTVCMAGAGLKRGFAYGTTDEIGWKAEENPIYWHDFHATLLHLLGVDHERLTYYHNGILRRLTNVHGEVIDDIIA